jgi:flagellar basal body-associated protein FliL
VNTSKEGKTTKHIKSPKKRLIILIVIVIIIIIIVIATKVTDFSQQLAKLRTQLQENTAEKNYNKTGDINGVQIN